MKNSRDFVNPFRMINPEPETANFRFEDLHKRPVSESVSLELGLLVMVAKALEMTRLLSKAVFTGAEPQMRACRSLGKEIHQQEKILTRELVASNMRPDLLKGFIRLPFRVERIGDMLESVLNCCRMRVEEGLPFTEKACEEVGSLFSTLSEALAGLRDSLAAADRSVPESALARTKELARMARDFRQAHWTRLENGLCAPEGSATYVDMLDSVKWLNEYVERILLTLMEMGTVGAEPADTGKKSKRTASKGRPPDANSQ